MQLGWVMGIRGLARNNNTPAGGRTSAIDLTRSSIPRGVKVSKYGPVCDLNALSLVRIINASHIESLKSLLTTGAVLALSSA